MTAPTPRWCISEPMCCDTPMVHNSWTGQYECADAYFAIVDECCDGNEWTSLERLTAEDVEPQLAETLTHWRESRMTDRFLHLVGAR